MNPYEESEETRPDADTIDRSIEEPVRTIRGMRAVVEALRNEDFPMDLEGVNYSVGDIEVEDGKGGYVPVRQLTDMLPQSTAGHPGVEFRSAEEVIRALRGLLGQTSKAA